MFEKKIFTTIEAKRICKTLDEISDQYSLHRKALIWAAEGRKEEALKIDTTSWIVKTIFGMKNEAIICLDQIIDRPEESRYFDYYFGYLSLKGNVFFESIREEPQFQQWLKEAKLVYDERIRKYGHLFDD